MLQITRIDHISMAVPELEPQVERLEGLFGFRRTDEWVQEDEGYHGVNLDVPGNSGIGWEVLAPLGSDSYLHRFIDGPNGPGLHHVAMQVADVTEAVAELRSLGIEPWGQPPAEQGGAWREAYIHPRRGGNGFLFQLYSTGDGVPWHNPDRWRSPEPAEHTLGITAINHLSHAHPDRDELTGWYERVMGMFVLGGKPDAQPDVQSDDGGAGAADFTTRVLETPTGQMRWEILQPTRPESFVQSFIDARGPAMHHVTFEVADWDVALAACEHHGVPTFGQRDGVEDGARWREAFIHPRYTGGFLAQFFWEERPGAWI